MQRNRSSCAGCDGRGRRGEHVRREVDSGWVTEWNEPRAPNRKGPQRRAPARRSLNWPTTQLAFVFHDEKAVAVVQLVSLASQPTLSPSCRSPEDAGVTRSRRVSSSPSWSSVSLWTPNFICQRARTPPVAVASAHPRPPLRMCADYSLTCRCFWHWTYYLREHSLRV